jgi:RHS repeat-associated protein
LIAYQTYGWLGAAQRSGNALAGLVVMGVRLYNPATGRFLSVDPVPGGNANAYTYPLNPIDGYDLLGLCWSWAKWACCAVKITLSVFRIAAGRLYNVGKSIVKAAYKCGSSPVECEHKIEVALAALIVVGMTIAVIAIGVGPCISKGGVACVAGIYLIVACVSAGSVATSSIGKAVYGKQK